MTRKYTQSLAPRDQTTQPFIMGVPSDLEEKLQGFNPEAHSNITLEQIRANIKGYAPSKSPKYVSEEVYVFFLPRNTSIKIRLADHFEIIAPLEASNYGFPDSTRVRISPYRMQFQLSEKEEQAYEQLLRETEIPINKLLETVGFIINSSMAYDFDKIIGLTREREHDASFFEELRNVSQKPCDASFSGICTDAGELIRMLLRSLQLDQTFLFTHVSSTDGQSTHDTTTFFDTQTGKWAIINSKSPTKQYNLVPASQVTALGAPYAQKTK